MTASECYKLAAMVSTHNKAAEDKPKDAFPLEALDTLEVFCILNCDDLNLDHFRRIIA
jgi:hypothetical protein